MHRSALPSLQGTTLVEPACEKPSLALQSVTCECVLVKQGHIQSKRGTLHMACHT